MALKTIEDRFNKRLQYPYVLFSEANPTEEFSQKAARITNGRASFGLNHSLITIASYKPGARWATS